MPNIGNQVRNFNEHPRFATTRINNLVYWFTHFIIGAAYLTFLIFTLRGLPWLVVILVGALLSVPIIIKVFNRFSLLGALTFTALWFVVLASGSSPELAPSFRDAFSALSASPLFIRLVIPLAAIALAWLLAKIQLSRRDDWEKRTKNYYWDLGLRNERLLALISLLELIGLVLLYPFTSLRGWSVEQRIASEAIWVGILAVLVLCMRAAHRTNTLGKWAHWIVSITFIIIVFILTFDPAFLGLHADIPTPIINLVALIGLFLMLLAYDTDQYVSRFLAQWRATTASIRHDRIRDLMSPTLPPINVIDRIRRNIANWLQSSSAPFIVAAIFIGAFIGANALDLLWFAKDTANGPKESAQAILQLGFYAGLTFTSLYLFWWFVTHRQKHIVFPFTAEPTNWEPLARSVTNAFVTELRDIGQLLHTRQVENVSASENVGLAMFVTSGQQDDSQIGALANLELTENVKISLGTLFTLFSRVLARTQIHGRVRQREDHRIEIQIEMSMRGEPSLLVESIFFPEAREASERQIKSQMRLLATRLVYNMGIVGHLSSTFESFQLLIQGLEASSHENWWLAITHYRKVIQIEETNRGTFGIGHYHLGAALLSQGELDAGLEHLRVAVNDGPPLPETHYMQAFTLLYKSADKLDNLEVARGIIRECETALRLRPFFPEAHFLIGLAYYKHAQLQEKQETRVGTVLLPKRARGVKQSGTLAAVNPTTATDRQNWLYRFVHWFVRGQLRERYLSNYRDAKAHLYTALQQYDRLIQNSAGQSAIPHRTEAEHNRQIRDRMAVTHRFADTLRCLTLYSQADSYYDDVIEAYPADLRTLVDRVKTYCLAHNWQRSVDYTFRRLLSDPRTTWNPAPNFFLGWAIAGGLRSKEPQPRWLRSLLRLGDEKDGAVVDHRLALHYFGVAVDAMDYALLTRPRRILRWRQTDWLPFFVDAACILRTPEEWKSYQSYLAIGPAWRQFWQNRASFHLSDAEFLGIVDPKQKPPCKDENPLSSLNQLRWLFYRGFSFYGKWEHILRDGPQQREEDYKNTNLDTWVEDMFKDESVAPGLKTLRKYRLRVVRLLQKIDREKNLESLDYVKRRLRLAASLHKRWTALHLARTISTPDESKTIFNNFTARLRLDIYAELTILTVRLLTDARAFWLAQQVAQQGFDEITRQLGDDWVAVLKQPEFDQPTRSRAPQKKIPAVLSRKVLAYQVAALLAWQAHAIYRCCHDIVSSLYGPVGGGEYHSDLVNLATVNKLCKQALELQERQPLALYLQAMYYKECDLRGHAGDTLQNVLDALGYFDPFLYSTLYIADWETLRTAHSRYEAGGRYLDYMGSVTGQERYETVISKAHIHAALADLYADQSGQQRQSVLQTQSAIVWSPYWDLDARYFMLLARHLHKGELFSDSLAATQEVKNRLEQIKSRNVIRNDEPRLFESMLYSRLGDPKRAAAIGQRLIKLPNFARTLRTAYSLPKDAYVKKVVESIITAIDHKSATNEERWLELAKCIGNVDALTLLLEAVQVDDHKKNGNVKESIQASAQANGGVSRQTIIPPLNWQVFLACYVLDLITRDAFELVVQRSKALNNVAYAYAKQKIRLEKAQQMVEKSQSLAATLKECKRNVKQLNLLFDFDWNTLRGFMLDTRGWIAFQKRELDTSLEYLRQACDLVPDDADFHYHLARVYAEKLHGTWKEILDVRKSKRMPEDLQRAFRHWHEAERYDTEGRLFGKLARLHDHLTLYDNNWQAKLLTAQVPKRESKNSMQQPAPTS